ncbi:MULTISPECIES: site-specific integrase [unclassified Variovorax]|uniref:site-specific integrase n=1 Tax=unclassified Variovorax TaxID=663243 RepID=UPI001BD23DC3|nr:MULTISPECIES: site-specific integrase [unclassified Variovorax]
MTPLRQRMLEDMGIRNLAENTQVSYLQQVSRYARHFERSPEELGPEQIRTYQVHLTKTRKLAPGSVSIATAALRFLYKVTLKREWAPDAIPMPKKRKRAINHVLPSSAMRCEATYPCTRTWARNVRVDFGFGQAPGSRAQARWSQHL